MICLIVKQMWAIHDTIAIHVIVIVGRVAVVVMVFPGCAVGVSSAGIRSAGVGGNLHGQKQNKH